MTEAARQSTPALAVYGAALTATVFWGLTPAMTKFVVAEVDPFTVGILRTVVAGPICLVVASVIGLSLPKTASAWLLMGFSALGCYIAPRTRTGVSDRPSCSTSRRPLPLAPLHTGPLQPPTHAPSWLPKLK